MRTSPDPAGAVPIKLTELQFTLGEAATLADLSHRSVRNWQHRNAIRIGHKHFLGRWQFSVLDVLKLAVMHDLCVRLSFNPTVAAKVAEFVAELAMASTERDAAGKLIEGADGFRPNRNVIVGFGEDGAPFMVAADIRIPGNYYPPAHGDAGAAPLRRGHVVIPVTSLLHDVLLRTEGLTRANEKAEALTYD